MIQENKPDKSAVKTGLHPRNPHRFRYDFSSLVKDCPGLAPFVSVNQYGIETINFADPDAVMMLNRALLMNFYGLTYWDIPENYLCPPVPGRADYIHCISDLLCSCNEGIIPRGGSVSVLDIGTGANCIYPIIGHHEYGWKFTGTDIDHVSVESALKIINSNSSLTGLIEVRLQKSPSEIFTGVIRQNETFDVTICNPPFHSSPGEAEAGTLRKLNNLNREKITRPSLNFGGQGTELCTPGGEVSFVKKMISESAVFAENCLWFTTLISKKSTLPDVYKALKKVKAKEVKIINMSQGQKSSRIAAWSFKDKVQQRDWSRRRWP